MVATDRTSRWSNGAFAVAFLITLFFFYEVVAPFLLPVIVGAFVVILFDPLHRAVVRLFRGRRKLASAVSSLAVLLLILLPAAALVLVLLREGLLLLGRARDALGPGGLEELLGGRVPAPLVPLVGRLEAMGLQQQLQDVLNTVAAWLTAFLAGLLGATTGLLLDAFLTVVSMYYFFLDGPRLLTELGRLSPLESRYEQVFFREFRDVAYTMVYVNAVTAGIQGVVGALGFFILGLPKPIVWGAVMAFFSFVPVVGTGLVWVPAVVGLVLQGRPIAALLLAGWGLVVIGSVDNVIRPVLAKRRIRLHPLLIFVTIFGGLVAFGPVGVLLGPLIGSLFTAMLRIWQRDFVPAIARATPVRP